MATGLRGTLRNDLRQSDLRLHGHHHDRTKAVTTPEALHGEPISLVDGGYLDNTGALTAKAVLDEMKGLLDTEGQGPESQYKIHLIIPRFQPSKKTPKVRSELDELVQTFLNVHSAYNSSLAPAKDAWDNYPEQQRGGFFVVTFVEEETVPQPLGWLISERARYSLRGQLEKKTCDRFSALDYLRLWQTVIAVPSEIPRDYR